MKIDFMELTNFRNIHKQKIVYENKKWYESCTLDNKNISVPINEDFHHSSHLKILVNKRIKKLRG